MTPDAVHVAEPGAPFDTGSCAAPSARPEIAFVLGRDLSGPDVGIVEVLLATQALAVAIGLPGSRFAVGNPVPAVGIDLRLVGVVVEKNGAVVMTASGAAARGHPAVAVARLVRALAADGVGLRAGQLVLSGALAPEVAVAAGDVLTVSIDRLGTLELGCC